MSKKVLFIVTNYNIYNRFINPYVKIHYKRDEVYFVSLSYYKDNERYQWRLSVPEESIANKFGKSFQGEIYYILTHGKYDETYVYHSYPKLSMKQTAFLFCIYIGLLWFRKTKKIRFIHPPLNLVSFIWYRFTIAIKSSSKLIFLMQYYFFVILRLTIFILGHLSRKEKKNNKIIFISKSGLGGIGDFISSLALDNLVRSVYPNAFIICEIHGKFKDFTKFNNTIDKYIIWNITNNVFALLKVLFKSGLLKYDLDKIFFLYHKKPISISSFANGLRDNNCYYYNYFPHANDRFFMKEYIDLLKSHFALPEDTPIYPRLDIKEKDPSAERLLLDNGLLHDEEFIVLAPESNDSARWYPPENFATIADQLKEKFDLKIVILGTQKGWVVSLKIQTLMRNEAITLAAKTSFDQLVNIISRARLTISIDTSIWHISQAIGTPTVVITNRDLAQDYPVDPSICKLVRLKESLECKPPCFTRCLFSKNYSLCLKMVKSTDVVEACEEMLKR